MKKTTLVVDGYNAINAIPETRKKIKEDLLSARSTIITITKEYTRSSGYITDFCVVFDGQNRYRSYDRLRVPGGKTQVFSNTGEGDDEILRTVREHSGYGRVVVASNDNYVRNMSRGYGASLIRVEELVRKRSKPSQDKPVTDKKIKGELKAKITREYREELGL
ncbi:NYN domain-containing protein [Candidatus Omnitrophota bacterium]